MTLERIDSEVGLWRNSDWSPSRSGLFAVIIGISVYDHLPGGPGAPASNGVYIGGQLISSALTAASLFHWLRDQCDIDNCPLAEVRLLLAPTADEQRDARWRDLSADRGDFGRPTFSHCERAIRQWAVGCRQLDPAVLRPSRALLFFSGHGLNNWLQPILLPSDYLDPGVGEPVDDAISVDGIEQIAGQLGAAEAYLFLDACQNSVALRHGLKPLGRSPFPPHDAIPDREPEFAAKFMACARGKTAFQFSSLRAGSAEEPMHGLTFYGQALLEALESGATDLFPESSGRIMFRPSPLHRFLLERTPLLVVNANGEPGAEPRMLPFGGDSSKQENALVAARSLPRGAAPGRPPPPPRSESMDPRATDAVPPVSAPAQPLSAAEASAAGLPHADGLDRSVVRAAMARDEHFDVVGDGAMTLGWLRSAGRAHQVLQHEYASGLIDQDRLSLRWISTGDSIPPDAVTLTHIELSKDAHTYRVDLNIQGQDPKGVWLEIACSSSGCPHEKGAHSLAAVIPSEHGRPMPTRVVLRYLGARDEPGAEIELVSLGAMPAPGAAARSGDAARLLRLAEIGSEALAGEVAAQTNVLQRLVQDKGGAPVQAMFAAALLLAAGKLSLLHDWARNLSNRFEDVSDGAVLWAEFLRILYDPRPSEKAQNDVETAARKTLKEQLQFTAETAMLERARHLARIDERGVPVLQPLLLIARQHLGAPELLRATSVEPLIVAQLVQARFAVDSAAESLISCTPWSGGLFASYYSNDFKGDLWSLLGLRPPATRAVERPGEASEPVPA